jgi:hypothetical protein
MYKQIISILLLLNFLNTVLFSVESVDSTPKDGIQDTVEEINSVVEFVVEDCMDIADATPEDEDDDINDPFKVEKVVTDYNLDNFSFDLNTYTNNISYKDYFHLKGYSCALDILSPPPRIS